MPICDETRRVAAEVDPLWLPFHGVESRHLLPQISAIYFLLSGEETVAYVGQTRQLNTRWKGHQVLPKALEMPDARVAWLDRLRPEFQRHDLEQALIERFKPPFNYNAEASPILSCAIARESLETLDLLAFSWAMSRREALERTIEWALERDARETIGDSGAQSP